MRAVPFDNKNAKQLLSLLALGTRRSRLSAASPRKSAINDPETSRQSHFDRATLFKVFAVVIVITFLLRIFYSGHLYQDDGLWFAAAEEILRGKALYREIYFDKPPVIALVYAALFKLFGAGILPIRLFAIAYAIAISAALYLFGKWLYDSRAGLAAALMFAIFSTTYQTGHFQGLNTDFLMALPYTVGAYLLVRSRAGAFGRNQTRASSAGLAVAGGALAGIAFQINPKAAFDLIFFALFLIIARRWQLKAEGGSDEDQSMARQDRVAQSPAGHGLLPAALFSFAGFVVGALPFLIYLAATRSLSFYWLYVWDWGARYARYYPAWKIALSALTQTFDYFLLNSTLLMTLLFVIVTSVRRYRNRKGSASERKASPFDFRADVTLLIWFLVSYAGLAMGGRFFGHYFFQTLPGLCLIAGRGFVQLAFQDAKTGSARRKWDLRKAILVLLAAGFVFTLVRFHTRTVLLAIDWARGFKSASTLEWTHEKLNREERLVAAAVRNLNDDQPPPGQLDQATAPDESRGERAPQGPSDYLFIWGYRPEIYYWSGLAPASKYLSTQPLTGVPADVHYFGDEYHSILNESETAAARSELARELEQTRPEHIVDELGAFNSNLSISSYPELREVMSDYKNVGMIERFIIYRRKEFTRGYRKRNPEAKP